LFALRHIDMLWRAGVSFGAKLLWKELGVNEQGGWRGGGEALDLVRRAGSSGWVMKLDISASANKSIRIWEGKGRVGK
jgi:hypothetical protein